MIYGYARCSTNETKQDIDRQTRELKAYNCEIIFEEYEHGDSAIKTEQNKMFDCAKEGDTVIVTEVSRLSRSTKQLCDIIETVKKKRLKLWITNSIIIDCRNGELDPMTKAFLQMAGVFSELELSMIRARVKSGMANAKAKGKHIGRMVTTVDNIPYSFFHYLPRYQAGEINKNEFSKLAELSRPTINKYLKVVGIEK